LVVRTVPLHHAARSSGREHRGPASPPHWTEEARLAEPSSSGSFSSHYNKVKSNEMYRLPEAPVQQESPPSRQRRRRQKARRVERVEPEQKLTKQTEQLPNRTAFLAYGARVPETRPLPSSASCARQASALAVVFWLGAASLP